MATIDFRIEWHDDWDGDHSYLDQEEFAGVEITTCELLLVFGPDDNVYASLGCIDDATDEYRKELEVELLDEARFNFDSPNWETTKIICDY